MLQAESEATVAYAAIALVQLTKFSDSKDSHNAEIAEINTKMIKIISSRVGADQYDNFSQDQMIRFNYEGTIRRNQMNSSDTLRSEGKL